MDELQAISDEDRMWAALAHGSAVLSLGGWVPLALYVVFRESKPFVAFHAGQATVFHFGVMIVVIPLALCTFGLGAVLLIPWMIFEVYLAWMAFQGEWAPYPGMDAMFRPDPP